MKPITRWELIKAIAEAYKLYYLDPDPTTLPISIIYDRYGLNTSIRPKELLSDDEHFILAIKPGFIGVEEGFEPSTSSVRLKRAPNCATGPSSIQISRLIILPV